MAITWYYRVGVALGTGVFRYAFQGGSTDTTPFWAALNGHWTEFLDPLVDPLTFADTLSSELPEGMYAAVADYTAPFETRKLSVRWSRSPASLIAEDVDVIGLQFLKTPGGTPTDSWDTSDYTTIESAFGTLWGTLKNNHGSDYVLSQYRWYADGPAYHPAPGTGNPARRVTDLSVAGTLGAGTAMMPPQDSETVTFKTSRRRSWGRIYWPAMSATNLDANGTLSNSVCDTMKTAWVTFLNAARAASLIPVVFSIAHSTAFEILSVQVDELVDVQRRRRWKKAGYYSTGTLT